MKQKEMKSEDPVYLKLSMQSHKDINTSHVTQETKVVSLSLKVKVNNTAQLPVATNMK